MTDGAFHKQHTEPGISKDEAPPPMPEKIGPYKVDALLSRGGMSWLYMGIDLQTKKPIAIKVLPSDYIKDKETVQRFLKESHLISLADHPNIVKLYKEGPWEGGLYIAMEWIHGISLRQFLTQQSFSLKRSLEIILQIGEALKHLHANEIIHRDLKPENVLISEDGTIKVIDFGIAQMVKDAPAEKGTNVVGTPNYMSPEQKKSPSETTYASDIYSLGVLAYELILGKLSYGIIQTSLLPKQLEKIINKALAISIKERYQTIDPFIEDITSYLKSKNIEKEKPEQDQVTEVQETLEKASLALSPFPPPSWEFADIGVAKIKEPSKIGLYYDMIMLPNDTYFILIADPLEQDLAALLSSSGIRGVIRALLLDLEAEKISSLGLIQALQKVMGKDPLFAGFAVSSLYLSPKEQKLHFFNSALSQLIHVPAGEESKVVFNSNPLLGVTPATEITETTVNWKVGDILLFHSLTAECRNSPKTQSQIETFLRHSLKIELFLSAQPQAEALAKACQQNSLITKQNRTKVLFSIQRVF
jgi:eukaryotic-like serine/threonine-protein kinase